MSIVDNSLSDVPLVPLIPAGRSNSEEEDDFPLRLLKNNSRRSTATITDTDTATAIPAIAPEDNPPEEVTELLIFEDPFALLEEVDVFTSVVEAKEVVIAPVL